MRYSSADCDDGDEVWRVSESLSPAAVVLVAVGARCSCRLDWDSGSCSCRCQPPDLMSPDMRVTGVAAVADDDVMKHMNWMKDVRQVSSQVKIDVRKGCSFLLLRFPGVALLCDCFAVVVAVAAPDLSLASCSLSVHEEYGVSGQLDRLSCEAGGVSGCWDMIWLTCGQPLWS